MGWIITGIALIAFAGVMAAGHYVFDLPVAQSEVMPVPEHLLPTIIFIVCSGLTCIIAGVALHRSQTGQSRAR
jgi:uncharacterized membrane protein YidH (DUF202 family)